MTVSRVINGQTNVRPETRERVLRAIEEVGYSPNAAARALNRNKAHSIGIVLTQFQQTLSAPYFVQLIFAMEKLLTWYKYDLVLVSSSHRPERGYVDLYRERKVDGLVVMAPPVEATYLDDVADAGVPTVVVHGRTDLPGMSFVDADNYDAVVQLLQYIMELGHERIGFVTGDLNVLNATDRLRAYRDTLAEARLPADETLIFRGDWTARAGYDALEYFLTLKERPTSVVCSNDHMAIGMLKAAHEQGVRIPGQLSLAGFDDIDMASFVTPMLTTVRQPLDQIGREAVDALLTTIHNPDALPYRNIVPTHLVVRESCGQPA
jgi:LacI family transcriptional regulator